MIRQSALVALFLFALYNALASFFVGRPWFFSGHSLWQRNLMTAQEYIYDSRSAEVVIVGSSLSATLSSHEDIMPEDYFNLSLTGRGSFEGLEIVRRCRALPEILMIEANVLMRPVDESFLNRLFLPIVSSLTGILPALRAEYTPARLAVGSVRVATTLFGRRFKRESPTIEGAGTASAASGRSHAFDIMLRLQLEAQATPPNPAQVDEKMTLLKSYVDYFKQQGVLVILFEMPCDKRVFDSPLPVFLRTMLRNRLPPEAYDYLPLPDCGNYVTTDAVHLDYETGRRFASCLVGQVEEFRRSRQNPDRKKPDPGSDIAERPNQADRGCGE